MTTVLSGARQPRFGDLLRRYRFARGMTQELLAERAGLSVRGISDLERGLHNAPRWETIRLLGEALELPAAERASFVAAARRVPRSPTIPITSQAEGASTAIAFWPPPHPLVDRTSELARIDAILRSAPARLLTLTGPPGVGKTRLATEAATLLTDAFADGVVFVELAPLRDPELVLLTIAAALGADDAPGRSLFRNVANVLSGRQILLILDNFEHVLEAAPVLSQLLQAGPGSKALVTSREPLRLHGERMFPVHPLPLPDFDRPVDAQSIAQNAAVTLFVARARDARPDFQLTDANATAIAEICKRVDGLPLAIELATPWLRTLSPQALETHLGRLLPLLTGGMRDAPERQRTLSNAIAWSHDLISAEERILFRRLGVFVGGWTLEAAEAIAGPDGDSSIFVSLSSLVDKNLVHRDDSGPVPLYGMLATVLEFAGSQLAASGEEAAIRRRHLDFSLNLAEEAESHLISDVDAGWIDRIESEHANIRAALAWALTPERDPADRASGLRMAGALWLFWYYHSHLHEGRHWLERALAVAEIGLGPDPARAKALVGLGTLAHFQGDDEIAIPHLEEGIHLWRALGDPIGLAYALTVRGNIAEDTGNYPEAEALFLEARDLFAQVDDHVNVAVTLYHLGVVHYGQGNLDAAARLCEDALSLGRKAGDPWSTAAAQAYLGLIYTDCGDYPSAAVSLSEALALYQQIGTVERIAEVIHRTAVLAEAAGMPDLALRLLVSADTIAGKIGAAQALPERTAYTRARTAAEKALGTTDTHKLIAVAQDTLLDAVLADARRFLREREGSQPLADPR